MRIGYYVQGDADEAVVKGLADRWCPGAELLRMTPAGCRHSSSPRRPSGRLPNVATAAGSSAARSGLDGRPEE